MAHAINAPVYYCKMGDAIKRSIKMKKWIVMTILLAGFGTAEAESLDVSPYLGQNWYGLYFNGEKVGYLLKEIDKSEAGEVYVIEDAHFMISMSGAKQDMSIFSKRTYSAAGELLDIEAEMKDPAQTSTFQAEIQNDKLVMKSILGGAVREDVFPKPAETLLDAMRHSVWVRTGPGTGEVINFSVFEPMYQKEVSGISTIAGTEERVFNGVVTKVYEIHTVLDLMDIESTTYVTDTGVTVEDVVAGVFTMRLEPEIAAKDVDYNVDTMVSNAVLVKDKIKEPRTREWLRLLLKGPLREQHLFNDIRQHMTLTDGNVDFYAEKTDISALALPELPVTDAALQEHLKSDAYVQCDAPQIIDKAKEIVGNEKNPLKVAEKICNWVSKNMRSVFSARLSNTLEALESMEGDCTEHTVLFVGLARAAGLPAKMSAGLIYVDNEQPGFYFHQWASVWLGEWVDVDPAFNQIPVDVTHIKFAEGDLFRQAKILPLIGRLQIEVLDAPKEKQAAQPSSGAAPAS